MSNLRRKTKLLRGWGVNDVDYATTRTTKLGGKRKIIWYCPYYEKWSRVIQRCFDRSYQNHRPTYVGCTIEPEWKYLSNFIKWVDSQPNKDWQNCVPDKDFLSEENKHYSPDTVVFLSPEINNFILDSKKSRGLYMIGVNVDPRVRKTVYLANCRSPFTKKQEYIGGFQTELEAHKAWQAKKHEYACLLADEQTDPRVARVLRERYAPDKDWTNK